MFLLQKPFFVFGLCFFLLVPILLFGVDYESSAGIAGQINQPRTTHTSNGVSSHRATAAELLALKDYAGTYNAAENYCGVVSGHGTGLRAPSEQQWNQLAASAEFVDQVVIAAAVPSSIDHSTSPYFPPIGNQGQQSSCVAWSMGYYIKTYQEAQEHNWDLNGAKWQNQSLTAQFQGKIMSPAFIYNLQDNGKDGGLYYSNAVDLICNIGCCTYDKMPYNAYDFLSWPSEAAWTQAALYRGDSSGIQYLPVNTDQGVANLKNWIASGHLASVSVEGDKFANLSRADVWTADVYVNPDVNHANTVVGYDDNFSYSENGAIHYGAFKVANSWGVGGWENVADGFYWISYETMKQFVTYCMFYNDMTSYTPSLLASFSVTHPLRGECQIQIGVGDPKTATIYKNFNQYVLGGDCPFCSNKIVFDITEFKTQIATVDGQTFYMAVYDSGTVATGIINGFAVSNVSSADTPFSIVNGGSVYVYVSLPSPSPSPTPTTVPTPTPTASPTINPSPTSTPVPTATPIPTPAPTATPLPTQTPTINPTPKPTPSSTPTPTTTNPTPTAAPTTTAAPALPSVTTQPTTHPTTTTPAKTTPTNTPTNQQTPTPTNLPITTPTTTAPAIPNDAQSTTANYPITEFAIASIVAATAVVTLAVALRRRRHGGF
jgi:C1A family cysteine protease